MDVGGNGRSPYSEYARRKPIWVQMVAVSFRNRGGFCGKSRHEATFVEMLLKPSATRGGKSSGVEEICAQGWVREGGRTSGRHDNLVA